MELYNQYFWKFIHAEVSYGKCTTNNYRCLSGAK